MSAKTREEPKKESEKEKQASSNADAKKELVKLGYGVIEDINKGKNPHIELSVRGLSNIVYDKKSKTLF